MEIKNATQLEIQNELTKEGFIVTIEKLESYAYYKISNMNLSIEPIDIVSDVLLSLLVENKGRNWDKKKYPVFDKFLFYCIRSHISNTYNTNKNRIKAEVGFSDSYLSNPEIDSNELDLESAKELSLKYLRETNATIHEEFILECWFEGVTKPQEIAEYLEISETEVGNGVKRLIRKLAKIQEKLKFYKK